MSLSNQLIQFLKKNKVHFQVIAHPQTFTASQTAETEHVSGKEIAKVVMARVDGKDVMLVLPASHSVDLLKLSTATGHFGVRIEEEKEFGDLFPECEKGALPALNVLYHLPCYMDKSLLGLPVIEFNAGTHTENIRVPSEDFMRISKARVYDFAVEGKKVA